MKKKNFKLLKLNKKSISSLKHDAVIGGVDPTFVTKCYGLPGSRCHCLITMGCI